jgi:ABC-type dipeptide/oligopeptide/nickel transport system permease component
MMSRLLPVLRPIAVRFFQSVVTLWLITVLFFVVTEMAPDFAVSNAAMGATPGMIEGVRFELGLNASAPERYLTWLFGLLQGELGVSWWANQPIDALIADRLWHSAWLFGWSVAATVPISLLLAAVAVARQGQWFDRMSSMITLGTMSLPDFVIAYTVLISMSLHFDLFPSFTLFALEMSLVDRLYGSALPIFSLMVITITPMFRLTRAALINVLGNEYIQMAELKGIGTRKILIRHAFPNAFGPIATAIALSLTNLFFGLVIIEVIYSYPGLGSLLYTAASLRDMPLIQACGLISAIVVISFNLLADTIGIVSNPRIRLPSNPRRHRKPGVPFRYRITAFRRSPDAMAATVCLFVVFGSAAAWYATMEEEDIFIHAPAPVADVRDRLSANALHGNNPDLSRPAHFDYFMPLGASEVAKHMVQGTLQIPKFEIQLRRARQPVSTIRRIIPAFNARFITHGDILLPVDGDRVLVLDDKDWSIILSPGRIWHEPDDGDWSRASFPFTLLGSGPHYGVATFLFNDTTMSQIRFQTAQETANWAQYDIWGQAAASYVPGSFTGTDHVRSNYDRMIAARLDIRPWSELADQHWRSLESFDGEGNRHNIAASGLMIDDVFYLRPCRTRAGPHPYCREMRYGVFSISKTLGAGITMLWLAQKYGHQVFDEKLTDYITIPAEHNGWDNVTFGDTLNMVTGIGNVIPERVDEYVEADSTSTSSMVWRARSIQEKLDAMGYFKNYPWGPGDVFRYRTSDTTALSAAMESYLRSREGPDVDLWDTVTAEVLSPLGINRIAVRRTLEPDGKRGTPLFGAGLYMTIEEALKIARLYQDHGSAHGRQLLHRELTARAVSNGMDRGYPNGWRAVDSDTEGHYELSFWLTPHENWSDCNLRIPVMAGFGGNYVIIMPNRTIGLRLADGHDEDPHTWDSAGIRNISDRIRSFCP